MKTRSNSSISSGKPGNIPDASASPLSSAEFRSIISGLQKTQNETLTQCKSLSSSLKLKFSELKTSVDLLSSQIVELKSENTSLRQEVTTLKNKVSVLESDNTKMPVSTTDQLPQLLQELSEREKCSFNAIVHGLLESVAATPVDRTADDFKLLSNTSHLLAIPLSSDIKLIRLGRANGKNPRPLKIVFTSKEQALKFIHDFNVSKRSHDSASHPITISVARDRTPLERQEIRRVYAEFDVRKNSGEQNILVRYRNGTPSIVSNTQRFHATSQHTRLATTSSKN